MQVFPLALLNPSIITTDGFYSLTTITLSEAQAYVRYPTAGSYEYNLSGVDSAIGHESTAQIMSELLGIEIPVNRQQFSQQVNQLALVFKLKGRPPEGVILSREQIEAIGYEFKILNRSM